MRSHVYSICDLTAGVFFSSFFFFECIICMYVPVRDSPVRVASSESAIKYNTAQQPRRRDPCLIDAFCIFFSENVLPGIFLVMI